MKIYLFRHGQKAMDFSGDPDLTTEGHAQATKILDKVLKNELPKPTELWVSPKKRTLSTFRPLSQQLGLALQTHDCLLEQKSDENLSEFRERIRNLLHSFADQPEAVIFMCSHYDFLVESMAVIPSDKDLTESEFSHWTPCQYIGFEVKPDGIFEFLELKRIQL